MQPLTEAISEQYSSLRVTLEAAMTFPGILTVGAATEADEPHGVACGLARAFAAAGYRTLLIDCGGGESLSAELGITVKPVRMLSSVTAAAVNGAIKNLSTAALTSAPSATDVSHSQVQAILADARAQYDLVIVDAGTFTGSARALQFAAASQGVALSFRFGRKPTGSDMEVKAALQRLGVMILGVVAVGNARDRRPEPIVRGAAEDVPPLPDVVPARVRIPLPALPIVQTPEDVVGIR